MQASPFKFPANDALKECITNFEDAVKHFNAIKQAMSEFKNVLKAYSNTIKIQLEERTNTTNIMQRQKLKDLLFKYIEESQKHVAGGRIYDLLQDLKVLTREILSVTSIRDEQDILKNMEGLNQKISDDLADILAKMVNLYSSLGKLSKAV